MTITIQGLTEQQRQLADLIWDCDSREAVDQLILALPKTWQRDAETVRELMILAVMDQHSGHYQDQALEIIQNIKDQL